MTIAADHNNPPSVDKIAALLRGHENKLTIKFNGEFVDDRYRKQLQGHLNKYIVFNPRWKPELWISPTLATYLLLPELDDILTAAIAFGVDANNLIKLLGSAHDIDPFIPGNINLIRRMYRQERNRGKITDNWNFWFHGAECQFKNDETQQIVEVIITNDTEYRALNSYFFLQYINTTPRFKSLEKLFAGDTSSVTKALILLEDEDKLHRIHQRSQSGIVAVSDNH